MDNWVFILLCLAGMGIAGWLPFPLFKRMGEKRGELWEKRMRRFDSPDRALAFLALLLGLVLLVQQSTHYHQGFVYQVSPWDVKRFINEGPKMLEQFKPWEYPMVALYWLFLAGALFFLVSLIRGTIHDLKGPDASEQAHRDAVDIKRLLGWKGDESDDDKPDSKL